jgi:O-antigen ligase
MAGTSPFIPYELSKYLQFLLLGFGLLSGKAKGKIGVFMLFLLLPALIFDFSQKVDYQGIVFNLLAPINMCLGIIYFYKQAFSFEQVKKLFIAIALPLISALTFAYIRTPDYDQIEFSLGANFETTGGFGSNQVSTAFGLGMFLMFYLWYNRIALSGYRIFDALLLILFALQGLLSFSRGGMIGGAIGIFIVLFYQNFKTTKQDVNKRNNKFLIPALLFILITAWYANEVTDGKLLLRYQGETAGTLAGAKQKNFNTISSNRLSILEGDWVLFMDNLFGVGAGASRYLRETNNGIISHVELGRLLSEHGVLGLLFFILFTFLPVFYFGKRYPGERKGIMLALYFVAWYTTFHAGTRTFLTPLLAGLSLIIIRCEQNTLPRK